MRTETDRIGQYDAKTAAPTVGLKVAAQLAGMKTNFAAGITAIVPILQQVQGILNAAAIPTIRYPFYYAYAREIWAAENRGINGDTLTLMAQSLHDKWEANGLATATLVTIADSVFTITVT